MANSKDIIEHPGIISKVEGGRLYVNIEAKSACTTCTAKGACAVSEMEHKTVIICNPDDREYRIGDRVQVYMKKSVGRKAVYYAYLYPFFIVLFSLILLLFLTNNEGLSALISLGLLLPYYYVIYKRKDKLQSSFEFKIRLDT